MNVLLEEFNPELYGPFGEIVKRSEKDERLFGIAKEEFRRRVGKKAKGRQLVRAAYSLMDILAGEFVAKNEVVCKPGCVFCCYQMVCCTNLEVQLIAKWLGMRPREFSSRVMQSAREKARPMEHELKKLMEEKKPRDWQEIETDLRLKHIMKPCPFFDESQMRCDIYPARPVDCRAAYVIGHPCGTSEWAGSRFPKTYYSQAASEIISKENERIFGEQSLPLFEWVLRPRFPESF